jgi:hypothetical protein
MDLSITHIVLVHERTTLCLDTLVMTHVLIMVIVSRVGMIFGFGLSCSKVFGFPLNLLSVFLSFSAERAAVGSESTRPRGVRQFHGHGSHSASARAPPNSDFSSGSARPPTRESATTCLGRILLDLRS